MNDSYTNPEPTSIKRSRPGALTALAVLAIILGVFGLLNTFAQGAGLAFGQFMQANMETAAEANPQMKIQAETFKAQQEVTSRFMWFIVLSLALTPIVAIFLLVGGIQAARLAPNGRRLLILAFTIALVFELIRVGPTLYIQFENMKLQGDIMASLDGEMDSKEKEMIATFARIGGYIGVGIMCGWILLKVVFFLWGRSRLNKPDVIDFFEGDPGIDPTVAELV